MKTIEHWINGVATPAGSTRTAPVWNPATGQQHGSVLLAEWSDVDTAVAAASNLLLGERGEPALHLIDPG